MRAVLAAIRIGLLDMRGDLRRFGLLIICLAVGTALISGVSSVGASIRQAVQDNAAVLMGGDVELSRADRQATAEELALISRFGRVSYVVDTNVRAEVGANSAFVDLISVGDTYPLLGAVGSPQLPAGETPFGFLSYRDGRFGALVNPLMLDQLGIKVGDTLEIAGTEFEARGALTSLPDAAVRGFRLGLPAVITTEALAVLSDRTSPLPGLGTFFRYKVVLAEGDADTGKAALEAALADPSWTVRSAREGLGPMVRYYDLFMRFLVIVGLASLLSGGVSVWTSISAYVAERANVIAVLRSMGAGRWKEFRYLRLPAAMPSFFTALRIGITYAVTGAVFAEYVGARAGLGIFMNLQKNSFRTDLVLAAVLVTAAISVALFGLTFLVQRIAMPWYAAERRRG